MNPMRDWLKIGLYVALIVFVVSLTRLTLQVTRDVHQTAIQAQLTMTEAGTTARSLRMQTAPVMAESQKAIRQARTLIDVALQTSLKERENVQKSSDAMTGIFEKSEKLVDNLDYRTRVMSNSFVLTLDHAQQTLDESSKAMDAAAGLLSSPKIQDTLLHLDDSATEFNGVLTDFHMVTTHYRKQILAPQRAAQKLFNFGKELGERALVQLIP